MSKWYCFEGIWSSSRHKPSLYYSWYCVDAMVNCGTNLLFLARLEASGKRETAFKPIITAVSSPIGFDSHISRFFFFTYRNEQTSCISENTIFFILIALLLYLPSFLSFLKFLQWHTINLREPRIYLKDSWKDREKCIFTRSDEKCSLR